LFENDGKIIGRGSQVEQPVTGRAALGIQPIQQFAQPPISG